MLAKQLSSSLGRTLNMASYCFTTETGVVVFSRLDCGDSTGRLGRKLSRDFSTWKEGNLNGKYNKKTNEGTCY